MKTGKFGVALFVGLFWISSSVGAQVVAKQGEREPSNNSRYHSPMILELPVAGLVKLREQNGKEIRGTGDFVCDDASLSRLLIVKMKPKKAGETRLKLEGAVTVRPSWDRVVNLRFELMEGADRLAAVEIDVEAEEGQTARFTDLMVLDAAASERLARVDESALLRLTMWVKDDR